MTQITITLTDTQLQGRLSQIAAKLADLSPAMRNIGESQLLAVRRRFDREVDPDGKPWQTLAAATIKAKRRRQATGRPYRTNARPDAILKDTFALRDSIAYRLGNNSVAIGTNIEYGIYNQSTRPFLGLGDGDRDEIVEIFKDYLN